MQPLQGEPSRIDQAAAVDPKNQKENGDAELEEEKDGKKPGKPGRGRGNNKGRGRGKGGGRGRGKGKTKGKGNAKAAAAGGKTKAAGGKGKARGGRGKAAGGRGKAAGRGRGKVKSVPQNPPSKKAKMDVDGHDAETPRRRALPKQLPRRSPLQRLHLQPSPRRDMSKRPPQSRPSRSLAPKRSRKQAEKEIDTATKTKASPAARSPRLKMLATSGRPLGTVTTRSCSSTSEPVHRTRR